MRRTAVFALAAVALSLAAVGPALSADLGRPYYKAPPAPPPPPAPIFNWTGFYIGGFLGGAFSEQNVEAIELGAPGNIAYNGIGNTWNYNLGDSFLGGGTIGYNWQLPGSAFVVGVEGEGGFLDLHGSAADPKSPDFDTVSSARIGDWYAVAAGRLGWAATPNWLIYAKGGAVFTDLRADVVDTCSKAPCGPDTINAKGDKTTTGWAAGAGVEWMFAPHWSVKAEYLFLGIHDNVEACGIDSLVGKNFCWAHNFDGVHTAKAGINYHF